MKNKVLFKVSNKINKITIIVCSILIFLLGITFFFNKYINFFDATEIFYVIMLLYFGIYFITYLITREYTNTYYLYLSLGCIISSVSGIKYLSDPSNLVIGLTLVGWTLIMIIIKLIKIEDLRNKLNTYVFINIFSLSLFILLSFLIITNILKGISNEPIILGYFFTVYGIFNILESISDIKTK